MLRRPRRPVSLHSVVERSLHEQARSLASWTLGLGALALAMTAVFPTIRNNPALAQLHETYPKALRTLFDVSDLSSPVGYVRAEIFSFTAPMLVVVLGVLWGSDLVAGEEDRGTIDLLLANPISRRRVLLEKWAALVAGVAAASVGLAVGLGVGLVAFGMRIPATRVAAAVVATGLLGLLFGTVALALGAAVHVQPPRGLHLQGCPLADGRPGAALGEGFLDLSDQEAAYIELRLKLARGLKAKRHARGLSQTQLAKAVQSSQSRVAKMEAGDPTVSLDLLVRSLLALGASNRDLGQIIGRA